MFGVCSLVLLPSVSDAERLPIRAYTTADGLAHNTVNKIIRDSRGFLWFATNDGLSRFDGYGFTNYSVEHGLPHRIVTDLIETRAGALWVATFGGLVRFEPDGLPRRFGASDEAPDAKPMFTVFVPGDADLLRRAVISLLESRDGTIWCGTRKGLFRLERAGSGFELRDVDIGLVDVNPVSRYVNDLLEDEHGSLWAATPGGLYRRRLDGATTRYGSRNGLPIEFLHDLMKDRRGRIWVASRGEGFFRLDIEGADAGAVRIADQHRYPDGFVSPWVEALLETSDGRFWATTNVGLVEFAGVPTGNRSPFTAYSLSQGVSQQELTALAEDGGGNLWIGTSANGAMKLSRQGFVSYGLQEGLTAGLCVLEDSTGQLYIYAAIRTPQPEFGGQKLGGAAGDYFANRLGRFDGHRFEWFQPPQPFAWGWVAEGSIVATRSGEWWAASGHGLAHFSRLPSLMAITAARPRRIFGIADGMPATQVYRLFVDSRDTVWFSTIAPHGLLQWDRATDTLRDMAALPGFPPVRDELPRGFGEDREGNVWIGVNTGVARYRHDRFTFFTAADGLPSGSIVNIHTDTADRLWLASSHGGLVRVDDPGADRPRFTTLTTSEGLSGNTIQAITSDLHGRLYVATGRGIDQLDPESGRVRHFTTEDGLAPGTVLVAFRDRDGNLWFGTHNGLSRYAPRRPKPSAAPPAIMILGLTIAGEAQPVSAVGATRIDLADLQPGSDQLQIDFGSLRFTSGERLLYQYQLEGADKDWGEPTTRRTVSYASVSPGRYRFLVRAVNADGEMSPQPAVVAFTVLPPLWQRWWFLSLATLAIAAAMLSLHRYRIARALEIERVRTRIASDLHDDIGANLTRIAILSEVARQQPRPDNPRLDAPLSSIATIARESVTSMSDIVWAISPERDTLLEVMRRMRYHAEEMFESRDVTLTLDFPEQLSALKLDVNIRRDLYLIYKEALNNAARHSRCKKISVALRISGPQLTLEVADDGIGMAADAASRGHGLRSMHDRTSRLGGTLDVFEPPKGGTTVLLMIPVKAAR